MESIDALAKAVNEFEGGMVLVSHDMRLISQVAKEIWICDNKTITPYRGDIMNFKMDMRRQMGIDEDGQSAAAKLRGDASVKATEKPNEKVAVPKAQPKLEILKPSIAPKPSPVKETEASDVAKKAVDPSSDEGTIASGATSVTATTGTSSVTNGDDAAPKKYIPPHLRKKMSQ
jgi:ATP-binding cassette subfamily F protein 2